MPQMGLSMDVWTLSCYHAAHHDYKPMPSTIESAIRRMCLSLVVRSLLSYRGVHHDHKIELSTIERGVYASLHLREKVHVDARVGAIMLLLSTP